MKLRVADRVAGQFFNTLDALMQGVAMETQPVGGSHNVAVLLQQRLEGLQQATALYGPARSGSPGCRA